MPADGRCFCSAWSGFLGSYFNTAAPLSLAYHGLGDFMVFALMGPGYVLGGYYVQTFHFSWAAGLIGASMGLLCSSLLQVNNLRDMENDRKHGKRTMAVMIGRRAAIIEFMACDTLAYVVVFMSVVLRLVPLPSIAVLTTLPRAIDKLRLVLGDTGAEAYNHAMARSGQLQFEFGLVLAAAFVLSRIMGW